MKSEFGSSLMENEVPVELKYDFDVQETKVNDFFTGYSRDDGFTYVVETVTDYTQPDSYQLYPVEDAFETMSPEVITVKEDVLDLYEHTSKHDTQLSKWFTLAMISLLFFLWYVICRQAKKLSLNYDDLTVESMRSAFTNDVINERHDVVQCLQTEYTEIKAGLQALLNTDRLSPEFSSSYERIQGRIDRFEILIKLSLTRACHN